MSARRQWPGSPVLVLLGVALAAGALLIAFIVVENVVRQPVVKPGMFRRRAFSAAAALSLLIGAGLIIAMVEVPLYTFTVLNQDAITAGLALLRMTVFIPIGALAGGWLSHRLNVPITAMIGVLCTSGGLFLMHLWPADVGQFQITSATVVAGLGFGLVIAPISTSALNGSERSQAGVASALVTALRMTGMILGLAGLSAWGLTRYRALLAGLKVTTPQGLLDAQASITHQVLTEIFLAAGLIVLIGLIPAALLWRRGSDAGEDVAGLDSYVAPLA